MSKPTPTHFTWSIEKSIDHEGCCPRCDGRTVLIVAADWRMDDESASRFHGVSGELLPDVANVQDEITGHWCPKCERLASLSLNTAN